MTGREALIMRDSKQQRRQIAQGSLPWGIANGMCFAKTRVGRYRIRAEAGGFVLSHNPSGRVWNALRNDAFATVDEAKACAQVHHDELSAGRAR